MFGFSIDLKYFQSEVIVLTIFSNLDIMTDLLRRMSSNSANWRNLENKEKDYHYHIIEKECHNHCDGRSYKDEIKNEMTEWNEQAEFEKKDRNEKGYISK